MTVCPKGTMPYDCMPKGDMPNNCMPKGDMPFDWMPIYCPAYMKGRSHSSVTFVGRSSNKNMVAVQKKFWLPCILASCQKASPSRAYSHKA